MKTFSVIMGHKEAQPQIRRHLPFHRANAAGEPIMLFCPTDAPVYEDGCEHLYWGRRAHHGPDALARFKFLFKHLQGRCGAFDRIVIHEGDSLCVSTKFPDTDPSKVYGNAFYNRDNNPAFLEDMYLHPPLAIPVPLLPRINAVMQSLPNDTALGFWDRFLGLVLKRAGIEIISFAEHTKQGYSQNTIHPDSYERLKVACRLGDRVFHGVKDKPTLDVIVSNSPWVLNSTRSPKSVDYISFSLYGTNPKYFVGARRNVELAKGYYPGWTVRFYMPEELIGTDDFNWLTAAAEVKIIPEWLQDPMFARYLCADDPSCRRVIFRDCDSRLSAREAAAVQDWITSDRVFSTLRDHPAHCREANGGLIGIKGGYIQMTREIQRYWKNHAGAYQGLDQDQNFLCRYIWPLVKDSIIAHDSHTAKHFPGSRPFPTKRDGWRFCGEVIEVVDGKEFPRAHDWPQLQDVSEEARKEAILDAVFKDIE